MKLNNYLLLILLLVVPVLSQAHVGGHHNNNNTQNWQNTQTGKTINASFLMIKDGQVYLETEAGETISIALENLSTANQQFVAHKQQQIAAINGQTAHQHAPANYFSLVNMLAFALVATLVLAFIASKNKKMVMALGTLALLLCISILACKKNIDNTTGDNLANDASYLASLFNIFSPNVTTSFDEDWFYVHSNGLPSHEMMTGITSWQQQVPVDQDYTGTNAWSIPMNPAIAATPLSTTNHLLKGALAIAVNGIPVFNPLNNRGEDALAFGELDNWGGHCGKADDYHYHVPPTHLQSTVGAGNPIAYALDGFPIYSETTETLDDCLGRYNNAGGYQYHTTTTFPYFMGCVTGVVVLDPATTAPEDQITPQALSFPVRAAQDPLNGATITGFTTVSSTSYLLEYSLSSEIYKVSFYWDGNGNYTYHFINPQGDTTATETYTR